MQVCNILDIARWQILHDFRETYKTENTKSKCRSMIWQILRQKLLSRDICPWSRDKIIVLRDKKF